VMQNSAVGTKAGRHERPSQPQNAGRAPSATTPKRDVVTGWDVAAHRTTS